MSDPVRERLDSLRARLILSSAVVSFHYHQEETVGDIGYFRVRCTLIDGSELQLIERFRDVANALAVEKYSFHWQRNDGTPICRWDNAPHHRDLATFPHHLHEGETGVVQAHAPVDAFAVLSEIEKRLNHESPITAVMHVPGFLDLREDRAYITHIHCEVFMNRTQIYLSPAQQTALKAMAARTGRTQSELIRDAIDRFVGQRNASGRASVIKRSAGIWKGREDLPDFAAVRREADRVFTRA